MTTTNADVKPSEDHVEVVDVADTGTYYTAAAAERGSASYAGAFLIGYDQVAGGGATTMPAFLLHFGEIGPTGPYLPSLWVSLWGSMAALALAIGGLSTLTLVGTAVLYKCDTRVVYLIGRLINGFAIGGIGTIVGTYISEVAPVRLRSVMQQGLLIFGLATLALGLGIVTCFVPDTCESSFRTVFALQWVVGVIGIVVFAWAPESPAFLVTKGRLDEAHNVMCRIYGKDNQLIERLSFYTKEIRLEQERAKKTSVGSYWDCFRPDERKRTWTVMFIYMSANWAGAPFLANGIYFLIIAGMDASSAFKIGMVGFYISIVLILLSWLVEGKFRRRDAFLAGCVICTVFMLIIGCLYYRPSTEALWGIAVLMNVGIILHCRLVVERQYLGTISIDGEI